MEWERLEISSRKLDSHRSSNSTANCACDGARLHAPYENQSQTIVSSSPKVHGKILFHESSPWFPSAVPEGCCCKESLQILASKTF